MNVKHFTGDSLSVNKPNDWLVARVHHMSKPARLPFGPLILVNDDEVAPNSGFPKHPHENVEVFTFILDGHLTHADSMGNKETLGRGCVQYMSAGTGVQHSEFNDHKARHLRLLQVWLRPDRQGHTPMYGSTKYGKNDRKNKWLHLLGGTTTDQVRA